MQRHLHSRNATCHACGRPLDAQRTASRARTCESLHCRTLDRRACEDPEQVRCRYCRTPLTPAQSRTGVCDDRDCRRVHLDEQAEQRELRKREEFGENTLRAEQLRNDLADFHTLDDADEYFPVVVPYFRHSLTPLPDSRRDELRANLRKVIDDCRESIATGESDPVDKPPPVQGVCHPNPWPDVGEEGERLTGRVCGHCRGHCCRQGETHGFVSVETVRELLRKRPDLELDGVVDAYLAELPATSFDGSCVFHGETGCSLPHEMRAETCGLFFCWGQQELRAAMETGHPRLAFVALTTDDGEVVEGRFLDGKAEALADVEVGRQGIGSAVGTS